MKKLKAALLVLGLPLLLSSCGGEKKPDPTPEPEKDKYEAYNLCVAKKYNTFLLTVETLQIGFNLTSTYEFNLDESGNSYNVDCKEESLREITFETAEAQKEITERTETVNAKDVSFAKFKASDTTLSDVVYDNVNGLLFGNIKDPKSFLSLKEDAKDASLTAAFDVSLVQLVVNYKVGDASNTITYSNFGL